MLRASPNWALNRLKRPIDIVRVASFQTPTATGNADITTTDLGGRQPKAVIFFHSNHKVASGSAATTSLEYGVGATDGTSHWAVAATSEHNQATSDCYSYQNTAGAIRVVDPAAGAFTVSGNFSSWIENGIRVNYGTAAAAQTDGYAIMFAGDLQAKVGTVNLGTGTSAIAVSCGFKPDLVILCSAGLASSASTSNLMSIGYGIAVNDNGTTVQRAISLAMADAAAAAGVPALQSRNDNACMQISNSNAGRLWGVSVGGWNSDGFQVTPTVSAASDDLCFVAIKFAKSRVKLFDIATPTSTGIQTYNDPNFPPQAVLFGGSTAEAYNTAYQNVTQSCGMGLSVAGNVDGAIRSREERASDPTVCSSFYGAEPFGIPSETNTNIGAVRSQAKTFTATGFTLNYDTVYATPKMAFAVAIER